MVLAMVLAMVLVIQAVIQVVTLAASGLHHAVVLVLLHRAVATTPHAETTETVGTVIETTMTAAARAALPTVTAR